MPTRFLTTILLAAGLAASKPIASLQALQALTHRRDAPARVDTCANSGSSVISALAALESKAQQEVIQINADKLIIVNVNINDEKKKRVKDNDKARDAESSNAQDKGKNDADAVRKVEEDAASQQLLLQQVNQALIADQQANTAQNEMDNILRAMAATQNEPDKSTVILVVQEIKISIEIEIQVDDKKKQKGKTDASVYKQEVVVANRGKQETETVMVYDPRTLTATDIAAAASGATPTDAVNATKPAEAPATKTVDAVLYNTKPTYMAVVEDPVAFMRAAMEAALEDRQREENRSSDVELNVEIAVEIKVEIEKGIDRDDRKDNDRDEEREGQKQEEEQRKKAEEQERNNQEEAQNVAEQTPEAERKDDQREEQADGDAEKAKAEQQDGIKLTIV